ncbi:MAG: cupin domain-containing protein [Candidatus Uhrbacteria bacterium]|nr:cupin domain-containing protein [Candidatus Uhrbacteria bacterium]
MTPQEWTMQLEIEGFGDIRVCPIRPSDIPPESHTHDEETVHVILKGKLTITDAAGVATTYKQGDRVDFPAGTTHVTQTGPEGVKMIVGVRK